MHFKKNAATADEVREITTMLLQAFAFDASPPGAAYWWDVVRNLDNLADALTPPGLPEGLTVRPSDTMPGMITVHMTAQKQDVGRRLTPTQARLMAGDLVALAEELEEA